MDVTVAVCTYGDDHWQQLAQRAIASAETQAPVTHIHGDSLHGARNQALDHVDTPWIVYLDADDELEAGYIDALARGTADLRAPAVRYVTRGKAHQPRMPRVAGHRHDCMAECIASGAGNWLVVGTAAPTQMLRDVGGWEPWPVYEDFAIWMRVLRAGATVEAIPSAVYRAHVRSDSRNRTPAMRVKNRVHHEIVAAVLGEQAAAA